MRVFGRFTISRTVTLLVAGGVCLLLVAGTAGYVLWSKSHPQDAAAEESSSIIEKVSKIYKLPTGEVPTVARIEDSSRLDGQTFYKDAKDGDYLLAYEKSKLALLYRASEGRLINVGSVSFSNQQGGQAAGANTEKEN